MKKILAVDIGTSRVKCAVVTERGEVLHLHSHRIDRAANPDTQDAGVWYSLLCLLLREVSGECPNPDAVSLTGNMHALLGVDARGVPVAPALLWCDHSAAAESNDLNARFNDFLLTEVGNRSIPVFTLPKMIRMKKLHPDLYSRTACFLQPKDFIAYKLTSRFATDRSDASGTLLLRLNDFCWSDTLLSECGLDASKFPEILKSSDICGAVTAAASLETGIPSGTPVVMGCGDLASAAVGSAVTPDSLSLTLGTAGQLLSAGRPGESLKFAGRLFVFAHADPSLELYLGSVPAGGFSFEWLARIHNTPMESFFAEALKAELSTDLPVYLPYILGRGAPYMEYSPCGAWFGLDAVQTRGMLFRAAVFGVLASLRQSADLLESYSGARKYILFQALADREQVVRMTANALFHQKKMMSGTSEASLLGAGVLGMTALGVFENVSAAAKAMVPLHPLPEFPSPEDLTAADGLYRKYLTCAGLLKN